MYLADTLKDLLSPREVAPKPYSLDSLIAWLETKDPDEQYDFRCSSVCLISQFVGKTILGFQLDRATFHGACDEIALPRPWTMGHALSRALAYRDGAK